MQWVANSPSVWFPSQMSGVDAWLKPLSGDRAPAGQAQLWRDAPGHVSALTSAHPLPLGQGVLDATTRSSSNGGARHVSITLSTSSTLSLSAAKEACCAHALWYSHAEGIPAKAVVTAVMDVTASAMRMPEMISVPQSERWNT